jgi:hypothetical protein
MSPSLLVCRRARRPGSASASSAASSRRACRTSATIWGRSTYIAMQETHDAIYCIVDYHA